MVELQKSSLHKNPIEQFRRWFQEAEKLPAVKEANAMCLSTVSPEGKPQGRMVLLKEFDEEGFVFYTNTLSQKGKALAVNPWAALTFYWEPFGRQIRIEGNVKRASDEEADKYFRSRPVDSQIGAWASDQSKPLESRELLNEQFQKLVKKFRGKRIPCPPHWGGYRIVPERIEFWQHGEHRLHDRFSYTHLITGDWKIQRLYP